MKYFLFIIFISFSLLSFTKTRKKREEPTPILNTEIDSTANKFILGKWCYVSVEKNHLYLEKANIRGSLMSNCNGLIFCDSNIVRDVVAGNTFTVFSRKIKEYKITNSTITFTYLSNDGVQEIEVYEILKLSKDEIELKSNR